MLRRKSFKQLSLITAAICLPTLCGLSTAVAANRTAPVTGFARSFLIGLDLANAKVTVLETGKKFRTDKRGHFGPFQYPVGQPVTLLFEKWGYKPTQSSTIMVPRGGLAGNYDNITFQVPSLETFYFLSNIVGATIDDNSCHVTSTITAYHKTLHDVPQGEENAVVTLTPAVNEVPFYFGIYESGPLKGKTNPFTRGLTKTSEDGGVAFFNLPPREQPYVMSATKNGVKFSEALFICKKGSFINISPPRGPMVLKG